ncbi:hypothetical protein DPMN_081113 [Dreissena polymorpha]|uniref:Uncharacterized protein n=1 Tax=Dreissena polymorpha TaxID=45954 RepID=A0A9D3Y4I7_DREPO|nr:hypothetical protein DPMN_081113 [Dreissena polymorpha]
MQGSIIFKAQIDIEQYLSKHESLGWIVESMQSLTLKMNPDQILTVKSKSEYSVRLSSDTYQTNQINGICCLPSGQVIVTDSNSSKVKLLDQHFYVSSHCDVSDRPWCISQITFSEIAVTCSNDVQFISVSNGQLLNGKRFQLYHGITCIRERCMLPHQLLCTINTLT